MESFKGSKGQEDNNLRNALEIGDAVPTIRSALNDEEMYKYFERHVKVMTPENRKLLNDALDAIEDQLKSSGRVSLELGASYTTLGAVGLASLFGVLVSWICDLPMGDAVAIGGLAAPVLPDIAELRDAKKARSRLDALRSLL